MSAVEELPFEERHRFETEKLLADYNEAVKCYEGRHRERTIIRAEMNALCTKDEAAKKLLNKAGEAVAAAQALIVQALVKPGTAY